MHSSKRNELLLLIQRSADNAVGVAEYSGDPTSAEAMAEMGLLDWETEEAKFLNVIASIENELAVQAARRALGVNGSEPASPEVLPAASEAQNLTPEYELRLPSAAAAAAAAAASSPLLPLAAATESFGPAASDRAAAEICTSCPEALPVASEAQNLTPASSSQI